MEEHLDVFMHILVGHGVIDKHKIVHNSNV